MKITKNEKKNGLYELEIAVEKEVFEDAINKVYREQVANINIPGFRKGKAPRSIIEKMYGKGVFYEDAVNEILPAAYEDAIKDFDKTIVSRPEFDIETIDENGVNIEYMYGLSYKSEEAYVVLKASDNEKIDKILSESGVTTVTCEDLYNESNN